MDGCIIYFCAVCLCVKGMLCKCVSLSIEHIEHSNIRTLDFINSGGTRVSVTVQKVQKQANKQSKLFLSAKTGSHLAY